MLLHNIQHLGRPEKNLPGFRIYQHIEVINLYTLTLSAIAGKVFLKVYLNTGTIINTYVNFIPPAHETKGP